MKKPNVAFNESINSESPNRNENLFENSEGAAREDHCATLFSFFIGGDGEQSNQEDQE